MTAQGATLPGLPAGLKEVVFDQTTIQCRVGEIARGLDRDYRGSELVLAGILKGAFIFASDLARAVKFPVELDFIGLSRYRRPPNLKEARITRDLETDIFGKDLLLVEDIVDTGLTLHYLIEELRQRHPRSIAVCTLLDRPVLRLADIPLHYTGFSISEEFVVGYGLDYRDRYRDLPYIASMET